MSIFVPKLQFEIRYDPILNFPWVIKDAVAAYTKTSTKLQINRENSVNEMLTFFNEDDYYEIHLLWDRVFITVQGEFESLIENNSIIEEPFLSMFEKIKQIKTFNNIKNYIINIIFIQTLQDDINKIIKNFKSKYIQEGINIFNDSNDFAIVCEKNSTLSEDRIIIGPYKGKSDLNKRDISITNPKLNDLPNSVGEMLEINSFHIASSVSFKEFKSVIHQSIKKRDLIWS